MWKRRALRGDDFFGRGVLTREGVSFGRGVLTEEGVFGRGVLTGEGVFGGGVLTGKGVFVREDICVSLEPREVCRFEVGVGEFLSLPEDSLLFFFKEPFSFEIILLIRTLKSLKLGDAQGRSSLRTVFTISWMWTSSGTRSKFRFQHDCQLFRNAPKIVVQSSCNLKKHSFLALTSFFV